MLQLLQQTPYLQGNKIGNESAQLLIVRRRGMLPIVKLLRYIVLHIHILSTTAAASWTLQCRNKMIMYWASRSKQLFAHFELQHLAKAWLTSYSYYDVLQTKTFGIPCEQRQTALLKSQSPPLEAHRSSCTMSGEAGSVARTHLPDVTLSLTVEHPECD